MKKVLIAAGVAALAFATVASAQTFNVNLTVGSTGPDVVALQTALMASGFNIPAIASGAAAKGYFGSQTQAAVKLYQASKGVPNTGFVGPLTRAALNGGVTVVPGSVVCPVGYTCTPTPGTPVTPITPGVITTPGVEGTLTATQSSAGINSTVFEAQSMVSILGAKLEAKNSDILVQRVKLDLGTATTIYNKIYSKIYVTDGTNVLASADLNSSTVVKDGSTYYITIAGMNYLVSKNSTRNLVIKADVRGSIDSTNLSSNYTVRFAANGIRGVDGAGIDQYSPAAATDISKEMNVDADLTENATLTVSLNNASPKKSDVIATSGANENDTQFTGLVFDVKAEKDNVKITDIRIGVVKSGSGAATAATAYLYEGSTELDNAAISGGMATFSNFDYTVPAGTTRTFTVKVDITGADSLDARFVTTASTTVSADLVSENSVGDSITESGSATGNSIGIRNVGAEVSLVSKAIVASGVPQNNGVSTNVSTSSLTATFVVRVKAVGGPLQYGMGASTTPMFSSTTASFKIYRNGVEQTTISSYATSTDYTNPSGLAVTSNTFTLAENQTVDIPVSFKILGRSATAALTDGIYTVELQGVQTNAPYATTFMAGDSDWRTSGVSFP